MLSRDTADQAISKFDKIEKSIGDYHLFPNNRARITIKALIEAKKLEMDIRTVTSLVSNYCTWVSFDVDFVFKTLRWIITNSDVKNNKDFVDRYIKYLYSCSMTEIKEILNDLALHIGYEPFQRLMTLNDMNTISKRENSIKFKKGPNHNLNVQTFDLNIEISGENNFLKLCHIFDRAIGNKVDSKLAKIFIKVIY